MELRGFHSCATDHLPTSFLFLLHFRLPFVIFLLIRRLYSSSSFPTYSPLLNVRHVHILALHKKERVHYFVSTRYLHVVLQYDICVTFILMSSTMLNNEGKE